MSQNGPRTKNYTCYAFLNITATTMPKYFLGEINVVFITANFPDSEYFTPFEKYRIIPRLPSSLGVPFRLSLTRNSTYF
ncbi:hypothetical protein QBC39DRAFT_361536, partial [Podospora conica]